MPTYNYFCEECEDYFELQHGMTEKYELCIACESETFTRVPSIPTYIQQSNLGKEKKVGDVVEEYITKNKKSIQEEKKKLKSKAYPKS